MIVDTSALVALVLREPSAARVEAALAAATAVSIGAPSLVEAAMVLSSRLRLDARSLLARILAEFEIEVLPFSEHHHSVAVDAFLRYGKGRHAAGLNFGDCLAYAVAKEAGMPLLFVGEDFARTDIAAA